MVRRSTIAVAVLAALSSSACERGAGTEEVVAEGVEAGRVPAGTAAVVEAEAPGATTTAGFVARIGQSDLYQVDSGRLALERSRSPEVRAFAQSLIDDHTRMSNELGAAIAQAGLNARPPLTLDAERTEAMRELREASASDFDEKYLEQQTEAHENARNLLRDFSGNGDNDRLKQLATQALPVIERHLQTAQQLAESRETGPAGAARSANTST